MSLVSYRHIPILGHSQREGTMIYTTKYSSGSIVYPLVNVGGPWVLAEKVSVVSLHITHNTKTGLSIQYFCSDNVVYFGEDNLFKFEFDARAEMKNRNKVS